MSATYRRRTSCLCALVLKVLSAGVALAQVENEPLAPFDLHVSFTRSAFLGVNESDAKAAFKVFATHMGTKRGYRMTTYVQILDNVEHLKTVIEQRTEDLLIIDAWDYLTVSPGAELPVEYVTVEQGVVMEEYLVLVGSDSDIAGWSDLEDTHLILLENSSATIGGHWLKTELMGLGISEAQAFFGRFEREDKASRAILPVFFGQADACVVDRSALEIMAEMNPQVGKKLKVVARSEPYLDTVACVRRDGWKNGRQRTDLIGALGELHEDPSGEQILTLFKFDGLTPFENQQLDTVRTLRQRYQDLEAITASRAGEEAAR